MANFLKSLPTITGSIWGSDLGPGSTRLSSPRNEFVFQGVNSGSYWNDTEMNFVFKSSGDWSAWNSASLVQNDQEIFEYRQEALRIFSASLDHILHTDATSQDRITKNQFHMIGGYVGLDQYNSFTGSYQVPSTAVRGEIFGAVVSASTPAGNPRYRFTLHPSLSASLGQYLVKVTSLDSNVNCFVSEQTAEYFDVHQRELRNKDQGIPAINDGRSGRFDVMVFSPLTGSL
jgi:hypothetical protein